MNDQDHDKEMMKDENDKTSWTPRIILDYVGRLLARFERWFNPKPVQKPKVGAIDPDILIIIHEKYIHLPVEEKPKQNHWQHVYESLKKGF